MGDNINILANEAAELHSVLRQYIRAREIFPRLFEGMDAMARQDKEFHYAIKKEEPSLSDHPPIEVDITFPCAERTGTVSLTIHASDDVEVFANASRALRTQLIGRTPGDVEEVILRNLQAERSWGMSFTNQALPHLWYS